MKKAIIKLATVAAIAMTMSGCGGNSPSPKQSSPEQLSSEVPTYYDVTLEEDLAKYEGKFDQAWIDKPYHNPFIDEQNEKTAKYYVVRTFPLSRFFGGYGSYPDRVVMTEFKFKVGYPCNSIIECRTMAQSTEYKDRYTLSSSYEPSNKLIKSPESAIVDMNHPAIEYDDALIPELEKEMSSVYKLKYTVNQMWAGAHGLLKIGSSYGADVVEAKDYNSTHRKDIEKMFKKMGIKREIKEYRFVLEDMGFDKAEKYITELIYLDWSEAKQLIPAVEERIKKQVQREAKLKVYEQKKLDAERKAKLDAERKAKLEVETEAAEKRKQEIENQKLVEKMKREGV